MALNSKRIETSLITGLETNANYHKEGTLERGHHQGGRWARGEGAALSFVTHSTSLSGRNDSCPDFGSPSWWQSWNGRSALVQRDGEKIGNRPCFGSILYLRYYLKTVFKYDFNILLFDITKYGKYHFPELSP